MNQPKEKVTDPKTLKRIAAVPIVAGLIALIIGVVSVVIQVQKDEEQMRRGLPPDHGIPVGVFIAMGGLLTFGVGLVMFGQANRGKAFRSEMKRLLDDPVLAEAMRDVAPEFSRAVCRTCPRCNVVAPANAAFCKECGAALSSEPCPSCGARSDGDARFCIQCGRSL